MGVQRLVIKDARKSRDDSFFEKNVFFASLFCSSFFSCLFAVSSCSQS